MDARSRSAMDAHEIDRVVARMAHEILERHGGSGGLALIGIKKRGDVLARRLAARIGAIEGAPIACGALDITLYRDDLARKANPPSVAPSEVPFEVEGRRLVLVDDVLFTGRSVRAAITEILDFGRPERIQLAVLVDRGGRELPIQADYVGKRLDAGRGESVEVRFQESDGADEVRVAGA